MKKIILHLLLSVSLLFMHCSYANEPLFYDTQGNAVQLSHLKGKWVIVNYWASWCSACVEEVPELNRFYQHIKDKNIVFYGVDYDELSLKNLKSSMESVSIHYPVLMTDPGYAWNLDNVDVVPTTFIISPEGRVVKIITGTNTEESLLRTIDSLQHRSPLQ